jgi:hypothetical protein
MAGTGAEGVTVHAAGAARASVFVAGRPNPAARMRRPVQIAVSSGNSPTFWWTPACRLCFLNVEPAGAGADQWNAILDGANAIQTPVRYGVVPQDARQLTPVVTPLRSGTSYTVAVFRWTGPGSQDFALIGSRSFTPQVRGRWSHLTTNRRGRPWPAAAAERRAP